jgi:hypothetical protein
MPSVKEACGDDTDHVVAAKNLNDSARNSDKKDKKDNKSLRQKIFGSSDQ